MLLKPEKIQEGQLINRFKFKNLKKKDVLKLPLSQLFPKKLSPQRQL